MNMMTTSNHRELH